MKHILTILLTSLLIACGSESGAQKAFTTITLQDFDNLKKNTPNLVILDVRTPDEIKQGKIEGALELDYMQISFDKDVLKLDKSKTIVVYCATGYRSNEAMDVMKNAGFREVYDLKGGIVAWQRARRPLVRK